MTTQEFDEGYAAALIGQKRNDNPFARGWSRSAALVMPDSMAAEWDKGFEAGCRAIEQLAKLVGNVVRKSR